MICCIVGLLILSVVSRIRRAVGGKADEPVLFAPVASRPAAGEAPRPVPVRATPHEQARADSPVLGYCALAIAVCLVGYPLLAFTGTLDNTGSLLDWALRSSLYLAAIVGAILLSRSGPVWRAPRGVGTLLIVVGAVVFELGMLDMHVFRLFAVDGSNILALMVFHNAGPALAIAGGAVSLYGAARSERTSRRSSPATVAGPPSPPHRLTPISAQLR